jgi:hypothetical protein
MGDFANIAVKTETKERFEEFRAGLTKIGKASQDEALNYLLDLEARSGG